MWLRRICIDVGRMRRFFHILFILLVPAAALGGSLESLVMPGKVVQAHAKLEERCEKCHESFSKKSQRRLCLACHKEVAVDIRDQRGLHGRDANIRVVECKSCHSDHIGRGADIVQFNKAQFDHGGTDFVLRGAHVSVACTACHQAGKPYRQAPAACYDCHRAKDIHAGRLGRDCARCHGQDGWSKTAFDHAKTRYPLTGKHREVSCALCHPGNRYKDIPQLCVDCHRMNDVHANRYGPKCNGCHSTKDWKSSSFDHDTVTKFPLRDKHKTTACVNCHKVDFKQKTPTACYDCHKQEDRHKGLFGQRCGDCHGAENWRHHNFEHKRFTQPCFECHKNDDAHQGRYGEKCADCHVVSGWREAKFDHEHKTRYPLRGKHHDVSCRACHAGKAEKEHGKTDCYGCHQASDVHKGKEGKDCQRCHNEYGWREKIAFDHDRTRFPLVGLHATTPCEGCHLNAGYKDTNSTCQACHGKRDVHKGRLGQKCEQCHNPNSWAFWQFDHDKQTKFHLNGVHGEIGCDACHKTAVVKRVEAPKDCYSCHRIDDIHGGSFGYQCERCHNERTFKEIKLVH